MRPLGLLVLLAGCAVHAPPPVATVCPPPPPPRRIVIIRVAPAPTTIARAELNRARASALLFLGRPGLSPSVIAAVTQRTNDATAAVDKLERRRRYHLADAADRKQAREAVGSLADYLHEQGGQ